MRLESTILRDDTPVDGPEELGFVLADVVGDDLATHLETVRTRLLVAGGAVVAGVLVGGGLLATGATVPGVGILIAGILGGVGAYYAATNASPEVTVTGVQKRYWTAHLLPQSDGTMVYDATGGVERTELEFEQLDDEGAIESRRAVFGAEEDHLPTLLDREENVETTYAEALAGLEAELESVDSRRIDAPLVDGTSDLGRSLSTLLDAAGSDEDAAVELATDLETAREDVEAVEELERLAVQDESTDDLQAVTAEARERVTEVLEAQEDAVEVLNDHLETAADVFALTTFNFYCPVCALDDIDAELRPVRTDDANWRCSTCQNRFGGEHVIPRHRIRDELVVDVWDQLWIEKDDQRREIHENIDDQLSDLEEREYEQRREEIRDAGDRIKQLRSKIRDLRTQARASEGAIEEIGALMVKYERLNESRKREFQSDIDDAIEEIDEKTSSIMNRTQNIEQQRLSAAEQAAQERAEIVRAEERRREREKFQMEQRLATQRAKAVADQHSADLRDLSTQLDREHKMEFLLERDGKVPRFKTTQNLKYATGTVTGHSKGD